MSFQGETGSPGPQGPPGITGTLVGITSVLHFLFKICWNESSQVDILHDNTTKKVVLKGVRVRNNQNTMDTNALFISTYSMKTTDYLCTFLIDWLLTWLKLQSPMTSMWPDTRVTKYVCHYPNWQLTMTQRLKNTHARHRIIGETLGRQWYTVIRRLWWWDFCLIKKKNSTFC